MKIGAAIKSIRVKIDMPQYDLAKKSNLSQASLSLVENGLKAPRQSTIDSICAALEIPESILYVLAMEESDISSNKKDIFRMVSPNMKNLALQLISTTHDRAYEQAAAC